MGLFKYYPNPSGRMGLLWTLGLIGDAAVLEFGAMGHMIYAEKWLQQTGIKNRGHIYTTHIDEKDIALGLTNRLDEAIDEILKKDSPKAIFLLPSSIPEIIGIDLEALGEEIQIKYPLIPIITLKKGGFKESYNDGIEEALYKVVKFIPKEKKLTEEITYNIIGSCADLSRFQSDVRELDRVLHGALGMKAICILSSDSSIDEIENMGSAHINLVIRKEGIKAAKELQEKFGTPYIFARPYGYEGTKHWLEQIAKCINKPINNDFINNEVLEGSYGYNNCKLMLKFNSHKGKISIGGNIDVVEGILNFASKEIGLKKHFVWCDCKKYEDEEIPYWDEAAWMKNINEHLDGIIMSKKEVLAKAGRDRTMEIGRGLNSWNFNLYSLPYMGFRGAMNLCSLWSEYLLEKE
jgi:nitrogenase molybdenum-iron protein alpha/beta subunit